MDARLFEHLASRIQFVGYWPVGCWEWRGRTSNGYGQVNHDGRSHMVHRLMYETFVGPIPEGLEIDHLCFNPPCCNPTHLEVVTKQENIDRAPTHNGNKTHCKYGHEYTFLNTYRHKDGRRECRTCRTERATRRWRKDSCAISEENSLCKR